MVLAAVSGLVDELIQAVGESSDKDSKRFNQLRESVIRSLKQDHLRVNPFEVEKQLDGLLEKFRVLNNDNLADALNDRLQELDFRRNQWHPEILSLLLGLSDKPALLSRANNLQLLEPPPSPPPLTWADLQAEDSSADDDETLWKDIDYTAESSDEDDISIASSELSIPRIVPHGSVPSQEDYSLPDGLFVATEDEELVNSIKDAQSWTMRTVNPEDPVENYSIRISELQALRDAIFMLQGLPATLFWRIDDTIVVDRRFGLEHASNEAFSSLLRSFGSIGARVDYLRAFTRAAQPVPFMQTFQREIEGCLVNFDASLSEMQAKYYDARGPVAVSLMEVYDEVSKISRILLQFAVLVSKLDQHMQERPFYCLDLLYDLVCLNQATARDQEFAVASRVFFRCFQTYLRPILAWIDEGRLDPQQGNFFVSATEHSADLRTLWHDWYDLEETDGQLFAPKFLRPSARKIFTTGKSVIFLRRLNVFHSLKDGPENGSIRYEDVCPDNSALLMPFSALLDTAFQRLIDTKHDLASRLLHTYLDERCGLWYSLEAFEYIYLSKNLSISSTIDGKIFELIDRGRGPWNDRFLLTELVQSELGVLPSVDSTRLIVRSSQVPSSSHRNDGGNYGHSRSVKILRHVSIEYVLPWPAANIIKKDAIMAYQRVSTFLMQIRRAKSVLQRQRLKHDAVSPASEGSRDDALGYGVRHNLLWFLNTLYGHFTELVISISTSEMRDRLSKANDVDSMIAVHQSYVSSLEHQCLLSEPLAPIHHAIIALLDLCMHFADIQASRHGENQFDLSKRSSGGRRPRRQGLHGQSGRRRRRDTESGSSSDDDEDDDEDDNDPMDSDVDERNTTNVSFAESPYSHRLRGLKSQYEQLSAFIAAGLRGVGRVDGVQSWEILAERLEWKKDRFAGN